MVHHNQVLRPAPGGLNPYHLGFAIWNQIYRAHEGDAPPDHSRHTAGRDALFAARESDRDVSFLRRFLDEPLMRKLGLFEYTPRKNDYVVSEIADEEGWERTKETLLRSVGMTAIPVIKVEDADFAGSRTLLLRHYHDRRDLELANAEKTLEHAFRLWGRPVLLETVIDGKAMTLSYDDTGLGSKAIG